MKTLFSSALFLCALFSSPAWAEEIDASKIRIHNLTGFSTLSLQQKIATLAKAEFVEAASSGPYTVYVHSQRAKMESAPFCYAIVGITHTPSRDLNPRIPAHRSLSMAPLDPAKRTEADWNDCESNAVIKAFQSFAKSDLPSLLLDAEKTRAKGKRAIEPRNDKLVHRRLLGNVGPDDVMAISGSFSRHFDYRHVSLSVVADALVVDNRAYCFAMAGLSGRPPENRTPRIPAHSRISHHVMDVAAKQDGAAVARRCEILVINDSQEAFLSQSWDRQGILDGFRLVREDGMPLPKPVIKKVNARTEPLSRP
jgi:hypothetical protein